MTSNPTPYWIRSFSGPPGVTISPPVTPAAEMRLEYDIRGGVRGKYFQRYSLPRSRWRRVREYLTALFFVLPLLLVGPASADWSVAIQGPVTISGPGAAPIVIPAPPVTPPPVVKPPVPPTPPVVVVPPPVVPRDPTPFVFPANCNPRAIDQTERYIWAWEFPGDFQNFYAYLDGTGNPLIASHTCAGVFGPNAMTPPSLPTYPNGKSLANAKLWVPRSAGIARPWDIRCVLQTGRVCP